MIRLLNTIENYTTEHISSWVHLVMVLCAFGSVANIYYSFMSMNHGMVPSAILAVGLGLGLALSAIMASSIPTAQRGRFAFSVFATLAVAAMSGGIQTAGYLAHGTGLYFSLFFGFGLPIATEVLLAIDLTVKHEADRQQVLDNAEDVLELRVSEAIAETLNDLDVSKSKRFVEKQIDTILRAKAEQLVAKMLPENAEPTTPTTAPISTNADVDATGTAGMTEAKRAASEQARKTSAESRRAALLNMLNQNHVGTATDELNKSQLARELGVGARTIGRDLEALQDAGHLNGIVAA